MRTTCTKCRIKLHWETMAGVLRIYRSENGRKIYRTRCPKCGIQTDVDGGRDPNCYYKSAKRILYDAERKIRKGWSQMYSARSRDGTPLDLDLIKSEHKPHSWCLAGAVGHANGWNYGAEYNKAIGALTKAIARKTKKKRKDFDHLVKWNDSSYRKKKDILEVIGIARELV